MKLLLEVLWAGIATSGFAILFDLRPRDVPLAFIGAAAGWWVYSVTAASASQATAYFASAAVIGLICEIGAVVLRRPAFIFIVCAILPIVPGSGMYYTMLQSVRGNLSGSLNSGFQTLQSAGAIAAGLAISSAISRLFSLTQFAQRLRRGEGWKKIKH
jgi:uncharacterized membrane protein YjjB (DUF3815 family)